MECFGCGNKSRLKLPAGVGVESTIFRTAATDGNRRDANGDWHEYRGVDKDGEKDGYRIGNPSSGREDGSDDIVVEQLKTGDGDGNRY